MKTIEEKAQAYDEALERAKKVKKGEADAEPGMSICEYIFPELKESEDEKIRKELKHYLEVKRCQTQSDEEYINCNHFLDWLEKQGQIKESTCDRCRKAQPSHSCSDITSLGRCYIEGEQKLTEWSEDEKIRKKFINLVKMSNEVGGFALHKWEADEMLAWLEKQSEQDKPTYTTYSEDVQLTQEEYDKRRVSDEATIKEVEAYKKGLEDAQKIFEKQGEQKPINEDAEKEKTEYVSGQFLYCKGSFNEFNKGESYWLEYIGNDTYIGRSDNILNQKFHITPRQLFTLFTQQHCPKEDNLNEDIFLKLKESEDEKIIKMLVYIVNITPATVAVKNRQTLLAWLEKQKTIKTPQWMIDFLDENRVKFASTMDGYDEQREVEGKLLAIIDWLEK